MKDDRMPPIIDARVRLPMNLRPETGPDGERVALGRYDEVLDLGTKLNRTEAELVADMDTAGVDHAILHVEYESGDGVDEMNETVADLVRNDPERFTGFGSVSLRSRDIRRTVRQARTVAELGLRGLNLQPAFMGLEIDSRELYPVYSIAEELGLIVSLHTGVNYARNVPMYGEHPERLDRVASAFPSLSIIACHASWPWVDDIVAVARRHPTVYLEFGGLSPKYVGMPGTGWSTLRHMMDNLLAEQVLFASDWPVMSMERSFIEWREMGLRPNTLQRLLGGNIDALLRGQPLARPN